MASPLAGLAASYRRNRIGFLASAAAIVGVGVAYLNMRRGAAPIIVQSPVATDAGGSSTSDLSAYQAGAAAAGSGFDTGAALGTSALGIAGTVVSSLGDALSTIAQSQADVAGSATGALSDALGQVTTPIVPIYSSPPPLPPPAPAPGGTPIPPGPTPTWPAILGATKPARATGYVVVNGGSFFRYIPGGTRTSLKGRRFTAWAQRTTVRWSGGSATAYLIIGGAYNGWYVGGAGVTYRAA